MSTNSYRKYTSTAIAFSFLVVGLTGVCFQFFFKSHSLEQIHGWLGIIMVVMGAVHIVLNRTLNVTRV